MRLLTVEEAELNRLLQRAFAFGCSGNKNTPLIDGKTIAMAVHPTCNECRHGEAYDGSKRGWVCTLFEPVLHEVGPCDFCSRGEF